MPHNGYGMEQNDVHLEARQEVPCVVHPIMSEEPEGDANAISGLFRHEPNEGRWVAERRGADDTENAEGVHEGGEKIKVEIGHDAERRGDTEEGQEAEVEHRADGSGNAEVFLESGCDIGEEELENVGEGQDTEARVEPEEGYECERVGGAEEQNKEQDGHEAEVICYSMEGGGAVVRGGVQSGRQGWARGEVEEGHEGDGGPGADDQGDAEKRLDTKAKGNEEGGADESSN